MSVADFFSNVKKTPIKIGVVGDSIIDVYHYGKVSRVSPEFPVQILSSPLYVPEYCPGGAANVAYQLKHFIASVKLYSLLDNEAVKQLHIDTSRCVICDHAIPRKLRFYDGDFPLLRYDVESEAKYSPKDISALLDNFIGDMHVAVLSNYNKGLFTPDFTKEIIGLCRDLGVATIVDPKINPEMWRGCSVFKPNAKEAFAMTGKTDWREQCKQLKERVRCEAVVITQAGAGVVGLDSFDYFEYRPKNAVKEVSSTIGAGDAFAAILALALGHHVPVHVAAQYAFEAGAEYVKAKHNRPITMYELHRRLDPLHAKIIDIKELTALRHGVYSHMKFVMTCGCWDIVHSGHVLCLQEAKKLGDKLIVAINDDDSVRRLKGYPRPIQPLAERQQVIAALECVDFVIAFSEDTPYNVINQIIPDVFTKGASYKKEEIAGHDLVDEVVLIDLVPGNSTSNIIEKIKQSVHCDSYL